MTDITEPVPVDPVVEATRVLRRLASLQRRRKQLKRSFEAFDTDLAQQVTECHTAADAILERYGPIQTVAGRIQRSTGWTSSIDQDVVLKWARGNRPGVVKETVSVTGLTESGCVWAGGQMVAPDGQIIPGVTRERSTGASLTGLVDDGSDGDDDE